MRRRPLLLTAVAFTVIAVTAVVGCGGDADAEPTNREFTGAITVFAAAALPEAFTEIGGAFEQRYPGVTVELAFDGSSALAAQIVQGAPADVFASADESNMARVTGAGLAREPITFATNRMAIITAPGNPHGITDLANLIDPDLTVVACAIEVPCGNYADQLLTAAGVDLVPASYEQNVRGVVSKVVEGEADAGIVYVTDAIAAGGNAELVEILGADELVATYPVAALTASDHPELAAAFTDFLLSPIAQSILAAHGFGPP